MTPVSVLFVVSAAILLAPPKPAEPASKEELAEVSRRGKEIALYDRILKGASTELARSNFSADGALRHLPRKTEDGWVVAFGRLNDRRDKFLVGLEAFSDKNGKSFEVKRYSDPKRDQGYYFSAALAMDLCQEDFLENLQKETRPYNVLVLPADNGRLWVYYLATRANSDFWPLGGDVRYLVSDDGKSILEKRQMHKGLLNLPAPEASKNSKTMGFHTHLLAEAPEDSDVYYVLWRKPSAGERIETPSFVYEIDPQGSISFIGKAKASDDKPKRAQ